MVKIINAKKGFAIDILYIIIIVVVIAAIIVIFWMSETGALYEMANKTGSLLYIHLP